MAFFAGKKRKICDMYGWNDFVNESFVLLLCFLIECFFSYYVVLCNLKYCFKVCSRNQLFFMLVVVLYYYLIQFFCNQLYILFLYFIFGSRMFVAAEIVGWLRAIMF